MTRRAHILGMFMAAGLTACTGSAPTPTPTLPAVSTTSDAAANPASAAGAPAQVPAFHGAGANWKIDLQADEGARHVGQLRRAGHASNVTLVLRRAAPQADPAVFEFDGTVFLPAGDTPLQVKITRTSCAGQGSSQGAWTVFVDQAGAPSLRGCGDITPH
ncbi:MAG: hypothetical protein JSR26_07825 [Proteobacteria bacterium]|nr:hypothetical protein [Pseudomonadota bacterium]